MIEPDPELDALAHRVIGAAINVHRELGPGLLESSYEEALCYELSLRNIRHVRQPIVEVAYKDKIIGSSRLDLWVDKKIVVELKAVEQLTALYKAQVCTYLKITNCHLGLLVNFNVPALKNGIIRIINNQYHP